MQVWWSSVSNTDIQTITAQLGKTPRGPIAIARRCRFGSPQVVVTSPVVFGPGRRSERKAGVSANDIRVFPTTYWLTCPHLAAEVGRLEGAGWVSQLSAWSATDDVKPKMASAHARAAEERVALVSQELQARLHEEQPAQWHVLKTAGIGGARAQTGVKCLHSHLADYLAGPVGGERTASALEPGNRNPVGARVLALLLESGVDTTGWPGCHGCRKSNAGNASLASTTRHIVAMDVGTNSCRMLCSSVRDGQPIPFHADLRTIRLGEGLQMSGKLAPQAVERTLDGLRSLIWAGKQAIAHQEIVQGVQSEPQQAADMYSLQVLAAGTNAVRSADNPEALLIPAWEELGLAIRVIKGEEEAELSFQGALAGLHRIGFTTAQGSVGVLDIGGGSTELVVGEWNGTLAWSGSVNIGAVRLTEMLVSGICNKENSVQPFAWEEDGSERLAFMAHTAERFLQERYPASLLGLGSRGTLVGVGGTCTTLAAIDLQLRTYQAELVQGHQLSLARIAELGRQLARMPLAERKNVVGLQPERADIIVAGIAILLAAMRILGQNQLIISDADILSGLIHQFFGECTQAKNRV